jgi:hypothetical protein
VKLDRAPSGPRADLEALPAARLRKVATASVFPLPDGANQARDHRCHHEGPRRAPAGGRLCGSVATPESSDITPDRALAEAIANTDPGLRGPGDVDGTVAALLALDGSGAELEGKVLRLLAGDSGLSAQKTRQVAEGLGIDLPPDMRAKTSMQLHIAHAPVGGAPRRTRRRDRQVKLDRVRSVAESLAEVDELASSQATPRALQSRIRSRAKANGLPDATRDELLAVAAGDARGCAEVEVREPDPGGVRKLSMTPSAGRVRERIIRRRPNAHEEVCRLTGAPELGRSRRHSRRVGRGLQSA